MGVPRFVDCATVKSRLGGLVSGLLTPEEKTETEAHLASCEGCRLEHHLLQAIHGTSGDGAPSTGSPPPMPPVGPIGGLAEPDSPPEPPTLVPQAVEPGLVLEPITPTLSTTPDSEVSFADLALESKALPATPANPETLSLEERPSLIPPLPSKRAWDFEPVDPPRTSSPPEESVNFAEEALNRSSQREGSRAVFRMVLWSAGALAGVALLAVSVWMAMAHRETASDPQALAPPPRPEAADSASVGSTAAKDSIAIGAAQTPLPAPPPPSAATAQPAATAAPKATTSAAKPTKTQPGMAGAATGPSAKSMAPSSKTQTPHDAHTTETTAPPSTVPPRGGPPTREEGFEPVVDGPADTKGTWSQNDFTPAPTATTKKPPATTRKPSVIVEPPPEEERPATPPDEADTSGPVGRLHLATVKAHEERDIEALRKIKTSWKSYLRTALGTDRARSKREYADCLWAIQEITGKDADRKEALTAYREYVLHAPAGGVDARSVARMRHLEDVLSDSQ
ncbi:MAG TPA: zf-HC2 domain-containing protein [Candidatus Eisenbacteria bacterium]|nr:zf-HC2 domain-containing protein [Candidatus Eisenbacteria bacterium]